MWRRRPLVRRGPGLLRPLAAGGGALAGAGPALRASARRIVQLQELAELKEAGILDEEEFQRARRRILSGA